MSKSQRQRDGMWEEPAALKHIRENFTEDKQRACFEKLRGRPPASDEELSMWVEFYTLEVYNSGRDEAGF